MESSQGSTHVRSWLISTSTETLRSLARPGPRRVSAYTPSFTSFWVNVPQPEEADGLKAHRCLPSVPVWQFPVIEDKSAQATDFTGILLHGRMLLCRYLSKMENKQFLNVKQRKVTRQQQAHSSLSQGDWWPAVTVCFFFFLFQCF